MATFVCFLFLQQKVGELYGRTTEKDDTAHDDVSTEKTPTHTVGKQEAGGTFEHEDRRCATRVPEKWCFLSRNDSVKRHGVRASEASRCETDAQTC